MAETKIIRKGGYEFPTTPRVVAYFDASLSTVPSRWQQIEKNGELLDFLWMDTCLNCGDCLWSLSNPEEVRNFISTDNQSSSVPDPDDETILYRGCVYCTSRAGRKEGVIDRGRERREAGLPYAPVEWPDEVFAEQRKREEAKRAAQAKWLAPVPMAPAHRALVYLRDEGRIARFDCWHRGKARVVGESRLVDQDRLFVLIPAIFGMLHENLVSIPDDVLKQATASLGEELLRGATKAEEVVALGWRFGGHHHMVTCRKLEGGKTATFSADGVACFVPAVNPAKELKQQTIDRLEYKAARVEFALHQRLVAEGKARGWCETFDPILVSQGLEPRTGKRVIKGTATFEYEIDTKDHNIEAIEGLTQNMSNVWSYVPTSAVKAVTLQVVSLDSSRILS